MAGCESAGNFVGELSRHSPGGAGAVPVRIETFLGSLPVTRTKTGFLSNTDQTPFLIQGDDQKG
jgi:hypothetical protein